MRAYLGRVRGGREPADDLVDEFVRRYRVIGGSPLIAITRAQADALAERLGWPVEIGMRFSEPSIANGLAQLVERGVARVAAIVLSPQYSSLLMDGYRRALEAADESLSDEAPEVVLVAPVQFLSDHLEVLYDLDVAARRQAEALELRFEVGTCTPRRITHG